MDHCAALLQTNIVKRKDLAEWEREYGGTTAEGVAKRVINQYNPSGDELSRTVNRGRGAGKKAGGTTAMDEEISTDAVAKSDEADLPESESLSCSSLFSKCFSQHIHNVSFLLFLDIQTNKMR
jgi:hypothetical protein